MQLDGGAAFLLVSQTSCQRDKLKTAIMDIDERLERLAERHEALAQSVELLLVATRENAVVSRENTDNIRKLVEVTNQDAENIRVLARIAESHERRITDLDGGRAA